jgi:intracellular septation protein
MKLLADFFPILLFFVAFKMYDIYVATAVAIAASVVQVGFTWWKTHKVEKMHLVTLGLIVVFGGATLLLQEEIYIKWKPTVLNWLFGVVFLASQFFGDKTMVERMMSHAIQVPEAVWKRVNLAWVAFFALSGAVNLYVVYHYDTEIWVNFKLFGLMGMTLLFVVAQAFYLARFMDGDETEA